MFATACSILTSLDGLSGGGADGGADMVSPSTADHDALDPAVDGGSDANGNPQASTCPGDAGPRMVRVGGFCIDATEVTLGDYSDFLTSTGDGGKVDLQPAVCAANTSFVPGCAWPPGALSVREPVRCVSWCDASSFASGRESGFAVYSTLVLHLADPRAPTPP